MKTLKYVVVDAIAGIAIMLLLYFAAVGAWSLGKNVHTWFVANDASAMSGIAVSMMIAGAVVGALVGFVASRDPRNVLFDPKKVTPEQLDQMESILNSVTLNANPENVDIEEMKRTISGLGASLSGADAHSKGPQP